MTEGPLQRARERECVRVCVRAHASLSRFLLQFPPADRLQISSAKLSFKTPLDRLDDRIKNMFYFEGSENADTAQRIQRCQTLTAPKLISSPVVSQPCCLLSVVALRGKSWTESRKQISSKAMNFRHGAAAVRREEQRSSVSAENTAATLSLG